MKKVFLSVSLVGTAITALAGTPLRQFKCENGVAPIYGEEVVKSITIDLDEWNGGEMSGLDAFKGHMTVITDAAEDSVAVVDIGTFPNYNDLTFGGRKENYYSVATYSDIFDRVGMKRISKLTIKNAKKWQKVFDLVCERTL
jgi:hypothetical protein